MTEKMQSSEAGMTNLCLRKALKHKINNGTKDATMFVNMIDDLKQKNCDESFETIPELLGPFERRQNKEKVEIGLPQGHKLNGRLSLDHVLGNFESGHLCFIGDAGSGKTTLLKGIAQNTIKRKYCGLSEVEVVVFIKCDQVDTRRSGSLIKILLSSANIDLHDDEVNELTTYIQQQPKKVLFLLDGIDLFPPYFYSDKKKKGVRKDISELMQGRTFPGCRIITSARSFAELGQCKQKWNSFAMLWGFSVESLEKIILSNFGQDEADDIIQFFHRNQQILDLCRTPMFLIFTLMAKKANPSFNPTMKSEVILFLFHNLIHSKHSKFQEKSLEKLGKMCYHMLKDGKTFFTREDLIHYNLSSEEIDEFVGSALVEGSRTYFFAHQSICDMLACIYMMVNLKMTEFQTDVEKYLHLPRFETVEYMLSGVSLNSKVEKKWTSFISAKNIEDKKKCLKDYFDERLGMLKNNTDNFFTRRLILSLYEAGESVKDLIQRQMKSIVFDSKKMMLLPLSDLRAIGSIVGMCERLDNLTIHMSLISLDGDVELLCNTIRKTKPQPPKIAKLDLSYGNLNGNSLYLIGELSRLCSIEDLLISANALYDLAPPQAMKSLKHGLQQYKLKTLDVSYRKPSIAEKEMLPQYESSVSTLVYKLDRQKSKNVDSQIILAEEFTDKLPVPGKWKTASYEFIHSVTTLFGNVKQDVYLYCWRVRDRERTLIQKQLDDASNLGLKIHLFDDVKLTANVKSKPQQSLREAFKIMDGKKLLTTASQMITKRSEPKENSPSDDTTDTSSLRTKTCKNLEATQIQDAKDTAKDTHGFQETSHKRVIQPAVVRQSASLSNDSLGPSLRIKISSKHMSQEESVGVVDQIAAYGSLNELELRCYPTVESSNSGTVKDLLRRIKGLRMKIVNLNITATEKVSEVASELHGLVSASRVEGLNFEESKEIARCLKILLSDLEKVEIPTLRKLNISYVTNMTDYAVLGKIVSGRIEELKLMNCDIESHQLEDLSKNLTKSKVNALDLSYNANLVHHDVKTLGKILANDVKLLALKGCDLTEDELKGFQDQSFEKKQVTKLDLSYNDFEPEDVDAVGETVKSLQVRELALRSCSLDGDGLEALADSLDNYHQLTHLDLRGNKRLGSNFSPLLQLLNGCPVTHLSIADCKHSSGDLQELADELKSGKESVHLSSLDISDSDRKISNDFLLAMRELIPLVTDELILCSPDVGNFKESIQKILNDSENKTIKVIYNRRQKTEEFGFFRLSEGMVTECLQKQEDAA